MPRKKEKPDPILDAQLQADRFITTIGQIARMTRLPKQTLIELYIAAATCELIDLQQSEALFTDLSGEISAKLQVNIHAQPQLNRSLAFNGIRLSAKLAKRFVN